MPQVTFKIEKQAPTITVTNGSSENLELFHGIGNTLGFNITGGSDFLMPITIFHVSRRRFSALAPCDRLAFLVHVLFAKDRGQKKEKRRKKPLGIQWSPMREN